MKLPPQAIREFQALWREQFGVDLGEEAGREYAERLLGAVRAICKPTPAIGKDRPRNNGPPP